MKLVKDILVCALLLGVIGFVVHLTLAVAAVTRTVKALPAQLDARAASFQSAVLAEVDKQASGIRGDAVHQLSALQGNLFGQVAQTRADLDEHLDTVEELAAKTAVASLLLMNRRVGDSLDRVDVALGEVRGLHEDLQPILTNVTSITGHADEASAILFRRDALPAQLLGLTGAAKVTLGETAQTMRTVRDAAPRFVADGEQITGNFNTVTANIKRLTNPHWYDRLLGYTLNGAILYRQLNPVTNLTLKGVQVATGQ